MGRNYIFFRRGTGRLSAFAGKVGGFYPYTWWVQLAPSEK